MRWLTVLTFVFAALAVGSPGFELPIPVDEWVPASTTSLVVESPQAVVCGDGSVWLLWRQIRSESDVSPYLRPDLSSPESGVFCRLKAQDGRDLVGPMRLAALQKSGEYTTPHGLLARADPDGRALVLLGFAWYDRHHTLVQVVDRSGVVRSAGLDFLPGGGQVHTCSDGRGGMHCLMGRLDTTCYFHLDFATRPLQLDHFQRVQTVDGPAPATTESRAQQRRFLLRASGVTNRSVLVQLQDGELLSICRLSVPSKPDTLPPRWLQFLRIAPDSLALLDSLVAPGDSIAGSAIRGASLPEACIVPHGSKLVLYIPGSDRTWSYLLEPDGKPVYGGRDVRNVMAPAGYSGSGQEFIRFVRPPNSDIPWEVEWYGISRHGLHFGSRTAEPAGRWNR